MFHWTFIPCLKLYSESPVMWPRLPRTRSVMVRPLDPVPRAVESKSLASTHEEKDPSKSKHRSKNSTVVGSWEDDSQVESRPDRRG